jgi:hypothetical protein
LDTEGSEVDIGGPFQNDVLPLGMVSKQVSNASQIADKALGPSTTLSPVAASLKPSPATL